MKTYQIQIQKVDNGFVVQATSDVPGSNKRLVATNEEELKKSLHEIVDHIFDAPVKPEAK